MKCRLRSNTFCFALFIRIKDRSFPFIICMLFHFLMPFVTRKLQVNHRTFGIKKNVGVFEDTEQEENELNPSDIHAN